MKIFRFVLMTLVAGSILVSTNAFSAKPDPNDCPCSDMWTYLSEGVTCVASLDQLSGGGRASIVLPTKYLKLISEVGDICFSFYTNFARCGSYVGISTEIDCENLDDFRIDHYSRELSRACQTLLTDEYDYLAGLPNCN